MHRQQQLLHCVEGPCVDGVVWPADDSAQHLGHGQVARHGEAQLATRELGVPSGAEG